MLKDGNSQRKISKEVWVSITTVTRWNKFYKENKGIIEKYIK
jgi:transposase